MVCGDIIDEVIKLCNKKWRKMAKEIFRQNILIMAESIEIYKKI